MATAELRRAWRFFVAHGAYSEPRGRARCALDSARAERDGRSEGLRFEWEDDADGYPSDGLCTCGCGHQIETCEACVCYGPDGEVLASLCGIWGADAAYRRVVEAELAGEALAVLVGREVSAVQSL